ncbi:hypothetical protein GF362_07115, partial [Candidatus Dojkabacteria bacterium]|nr:hypothetical protein [Candidatus Dojkabacteria bacterium]
MKKNIKSRVLALIFLLFCFYLSFSFDVWAAESILSFSELQFSPTVNPGESFNVSFKIINDTNEDVALDKCLFPVKLPTENLIEAPYVIEQAGASGSLYSYGIDSTVPINIDFNFTQTHGEMDMQYLPLNAGDYLEMNVTFGTTEAIAETKDFYFDLNCMDTDQNTFISGPMQIQITSQPLPDIEGSVFEEHILELFNEGIISGYSDGMYHEEREVTRGAMAKFVKNAFGIETDTSCGDFPDVESS